ncbi:unnamed protein product [Zymoseptoria tritici ST99CH_1E4]|uniref:AB hydrolase-1 domain-containing protein n=1 Tax=Zymoseptoria tritici ST99CH_1E4 TaxID=1276532 RepID=A0A2H1FML8_ZYMTR|nr:unnamed protein product [Zymoseptoria tritici ST99CH_1E4]
MDLPSSFPYKAWTIRYNVIESESASTPSQTRGEKRSIVFVHGTPWSSAVYKPVISSLLATNTPYRILIYDLPGYGRSQAYFSTSPDAVTKANLPGDTSVAFQAQALAALLEHTHSSSSDSQTPPAVIAHDIAGAIVLRAHLLHGVEFSSMLLCDTNAVLPWGDGFYKLVRSQPQVFLELPRHAFEAVVIFVVKSALHRAKEVGDEWVDVLSSPWVGGASEVESKERQMSFVRQIAQADDGDVKQMLDQQVYRKVRCEVKMTRGEEDSWIPREKLEELRERMGVTVKELVPIADAGHLVMLDQPERFEREVFDWLSSLG